MHAQADSRVHLPAVVLPAAAAVAGTSCPAPCSCNVPSDAESASSQLLLLSMVLAAALAAEAAAAAAPSSRPRNQAPAQDSSNKQQPDTWASGQQLPNATHHSPPGCPNRKLRGSKLREARGVCCVLDKQGESKVCSPDCSTRSLLG